MKRFFLGVAFVGAGLASAGVSSAHDCAQGLVGGGQFERSDSDRDGRVTVAEARAAALELFDDLDENRDGVVALAEIEPGARRWRRRRFEARFDAADRDGDGSLTARELGVQPRLLVGWDADGDQRFTRVELGRAFSGSGRGVAGAAAMSARVVRWDLNRDGRVTREEAMAVADRRFARKDRNRDGVLTSPEAQPLGAERSPR